MSEVSEWCLNHAPRLVGKEALMSAAVEIVAELGISHLTYAQIGLEGLRHLETNYPDKWQKYYQSHDLYRCDPVVKASKKTPCITTWSTDCAANDIDGRRFQDLAKPFDIPSQGAIATFQSGCGRTIVSLATRLDPSDWHLNFEQHVSDYLLFAATFSGQLHHFHSIETGILSPRERDVILWAARGKTAWETAGILGLTEGTVNQYIRGAITKMNASSKLHCVTLALDFGLLDEN